MKILILAVIAIASCTAQGFIQEPLVEQARLTCEDGVESIQAIHANSIEFRCSDGTNHVLFRN